MEDIYIYIACVPERSDITQPPPLQLPQPMKDMEYMTVSVRNEGGGDAEGVRKSSLFTEKCSFFCVKGSCMGRRWRGERGSDHHMSAQHLSV